MAEPRSAFRGGTAPTEAGLRAKPALRQTGAAVGVQVDACGVPLRLGNACVGRSCVAAEAEHGAQQHQTFLHRQYGVVAVHIELALRA